MKFEADHIEAVAGKPNASSSSASGSLLPSGRRAAVRGKESDQL
jgi:hypothetical protein